MARSISPSTVPDNHLRLTGLHETQSIDKFSYGLSDRGASVRMPVNFIKNGYTGYLEDRRPNSQATPTRSFRSSSRPSTASPKPNWRTTTQQKRPDLIRDQGVSF